MTSVVWVVDMISAVWIIKAVCRQERCVALLYNILCEKNFSCIHMTALLLQAIPIFAPLLCCVCLYIGNIYKSQQYAHIIRKINIDIYKYRNAFTATTTPHYAKLLSSCVMNWIFLLPSKATLPSAKAFKVMRLFKKNRCFFLMSLKENVKNLLSN